MTTKQTEALEHAYGLLERLVIRLNVLNNMGAGCHSEARLAKEALTAVVFAMGSYSPEPNSPSLK